MREIWHDHLKVGAVLALGLTLLALDVLDGAAFGVPPLHLLEESLVVTGGLVWIALLVVKRDALRRASSALARELWSARDALGDAREEVRALSKGLSDKVEAQLEEWSLTPSEREVAMLLLKGFGLRRIGELRGTSERTVRQQAASVYQKAGLAGRAELSAFFFEDLLVLPSAEAVRSPDDVGHPAAIAHA